MAGELADLPDVAAGEVKGPGDPLVTEPVRPGLATQAGARGSA